MTQMRATGLAAILLLICATSAVGQVAAPTTHLKVMTSGGFAAPLAAVLPEFEKSSGISVEVTRGASQGPGPATIGAQLRSGISADMVIMSREGLDDLIADGRVVAHSDRDLASTPLGLSVRAGAPKPDIRNLDSFRQTLLNAKSVTFPASTSGTYLTGTVFPRLGIADAMKSKSSNAGVVAVAHGEAEIAIQPESELLHAPGTDFVGLIPAQSQFVSMFSTALVAGSNNQAAARQLMDFLASAKARGAMRDSGMTPRR